MHRSCHLYMTATVLPQMVVLTRLALTKGTKPIWRRVLVVTILILLSNSILHPNPSKNFPMKSEQQTLLHLRRFVHKKLSWYHIVFMHMNSISYFWLWKPPGILICFCLKFQDSDAEEDYFAEILKDDIIKLDETPLSARPGISPRIASSSDADQRRREQPRKENEPHVAHLQGTANRRIKLRKPKAGDYVVAAKGSTELERGVGEMSIEKLTSPKSGDSPKWLLSLFAPSTANLRFIYATFVILTLVALFLTVLLGGFQACKKLQIYATLLNNLWHWILCII